MSGDHRTCPTSFLAQKTFHDPNATREQLYNFV